MMMERLPKEVRSMILLSRIRRFRSRRIVEWETPCLEYYFLSSLTKTVHFFYFSRALYPGRAMYDDSMHPLQSSVLPLL